MRGRLMLLTCAACASLGSSALARTNAPYLVIYPECWQAAVTNHIAFKTRLGFDVHTHTIETITAGALTNYQAVRQCLAEFRSNNVPAGELGCVLFVGDYRTIPAPRFKVDAEGSVTNHSDIYYRDLHTDWDYNNNGLFGEYSASGAPDFDATRFNTIFPSISNDLSVGRIPLASNTPVEIVRRIMDASLAFERESGPRKRQAIISAGRIDTTVGADSWDYVAKGLVTTIETSYADHSITTVVHVATNYTTREGIDYVVEGGVSAATYRQGQNMVRSLWETFDRCSFLCNVSHGSAQYDFALTQTGSGFPRRVRSAVIISMSCATFELGAAALSNGVATAYLGSSEIVTPDVMTLLSGSEMISGLVQKRAALQLFCENRSVGETFDDGFNYYVKHIQDPAAWYTYTYEKMSVLRNVVGFQIIGDPTLVHAYPDSDSDELLDEEEAHVGTNIHDPDTDDDELPDGFEIGHADVVNPLVFDGLDCDADQVHNAAELAAGTDPLNAASYPHAACDKVTTDGALVISWETVTNRFYTVESSPVNDLREWIVCWGPVTGSSATLCFTNPAAPVIGRVFRVWIGRN